MELALLKHEFKTITSKEDMQKTQISCLFSGTPYQFSQSLQLVHEAKRVATHPSLVHEEWHSKHDLVNDP